MIVDVDSDEGKLFEFEKILSLFGHLMCCFVCHDFCFTVLKHLLL